MIPENDKFSARATLLGFALVVLVIVGASLLVLVSRPEPVMIAIQPPLPTATALPAGTPAPILVYVTGAVNQPETTVSLPVGSRVQDALTAAGGVAQDADLTRVNLAAMLRDGDQVHVPLWSEEIAVLPTRIGGEQIGVNSATVEELQRLPGIGPALAERIVSYREQNGAFTEAADLDLVSGIGPALLEEILPLIVFD